MARLPEHLRGAPAGRQSLPREVMREHQRERVLARAVPVFAERGYNGTTVDDLLAAGKVGVGNFYALFAGKEECFAAAYERVLTIVRERIDLATVGHQDWAARTYLGLRALIEFGLRWPREARLVLNEAQSAGAASLARHEALLDEARAWLRRGRQEYPEARDLPPGFERAAVAGLVFYLQQCLLDPDAHEQGELFAEVAALVIEPITGARTLASLF